MKTYVVGTLQGASNEYPQHMFSWRNKKKYLLDTHSLSRPMCSKGSGHLTIMAVWSFYVASLPFLLEILSRSKWLLSLLLCLQHWVLENFQISSNSDASLTFDLFMSS